MTTEFAAGDDFSYYGEGIMQQESKKPEDLAQKDPLIVPSSGGVDFDLSATRGSLSEIKKTAKMVHEGGVNHSVTLIGWGQDDKK
jgi:hypothetical protein